MTAPALLFVLNDAASFTTFRQPAARAARAEGFEVHVAAPRGPGVDEIRRQGFPFHPIRLARRSMNPVRETAAVASLFSLYRRVRPSLVHHVTIKPVIYGSWAARAAKVPAVVNAVTGLGWVFTPGRGGRRVVRWGVAKAYRSAFRHPNQRTVFQNGEDLAQFVGMRLLGLDRTALIRGSGVDTSRFRPAAEPRGTPVVVLPARLLWDKGIAEFVEAARILRARGVPVRMCLVGATDPGNPSSVPDWQVARWAEEGLVEVWGWRRDMDQVFAQSHIVCLPSYREGIPKALLEAAAAGRPLVATDTAGCREIVRDGATGLRVPAKDPVALADALERLVQDAGLRRRLGAAARRVAVEEFDERIVTERTRELYRDLVAAIR